MGRYFTQSAPSGKCSFGDNFDVTVNTITIHARAYRDTFAANRAVGGKWGSTAFAYLLQINQPSGATDVAFANASHVAGGTNSTGVWASLVGRKKGTGANQTQAFKNGSSAATGTDAGTQAGTADSFIIGQVGFSSSVEGLDGGVADWATWNVDLTDAEISALAAGVNPTLIRPLSLVCYIPLWGAHSPEIDYLSGVTGTLSGAFSAISHPGKAGPPAPRLAVAA